MDPGSVGLAKTRLGHVLTAATINVPRVADRLGDETCVETHRSTFAPPLSQPADG